MNSIPQRVLYSKKQFQLASCQNDQKNTPQKLIYQQSRICIQISSEFTTQTLIFTRIEHNNELRALKKNFRLHALKVHHRNLHTINISRKQTKNSRNFTQNWSHRYTEERNSEPDSTKIDLRRKIANQKQLQISTQRLLPSLDEPIQDPSLRFTEPKLWYHDSYGRIMEIEDYRNQENVEIVKMENSENMEHREKTAWRRSWLFHYIENWWIIFIVAAKT